MILRQSGHSGIKVDQGPEIIDDGDKFFIFTTGSTSKHPDQIGIKRLTRVRFRKHMDLSKSLSQRFQEKQMADRRRRREAMVYGEDAAPQEETHAPDWRSYPAVSHLFDGIDALFDIGGKNMGNHVTTTCPRGSFLL